MATKTQVLVGRLEPKAAVAWTALTKKYRLAASWNFIPMLLAVAQSLLVLLPKMNIRGPMFAGNPTDCLNHMVTAKLVTLPKPNAVLVTAAKFPLPPWRGCEERFKARLPVVNPATPEFAAPWRLVPAPFLFNICKAAFTPPLLVSLGVVV